MLVTHDAVRYQVEQQVADTPAYRAYLGIESTGGRQCLLQVATDRIHNGALDRAAFVLHELKGASDAIEAKNKDTGGEQYRPFNYDRLFPQVVDSFISPEQGQRRVNVLTFKDVEDVKRLSPLSSLTRRDRLRLDLPSSAWIMGRLLKLLGLTHNAGTAVQMLSGNNVLVELERHLVVVFDWSSARLYNGKVPSEECRQEIADAARTVFTAIGGNALTLDYPFDCDGSETYVELLRSLANQYTDDALKAHRQFYELVYGAFGRGFKPTNLLPL